MEKGQLAHCPPARGLGSAVSSHQHLSTIFLYSRQHNTATSFWENNCRSLSIWQQGAMASELWGVTLYPPSSGLVPPVSPSQRCGLCQNFKQTTLTTRLYKVRTNLHPPPLTKTFQRAWQGRLCQPSWGQKLHEQARGLSSVAGGSTPWTPVNSHPGNHCQ